MMRSSSGHLERALRVRLAANIGQVDREWSGRGDVGARARRLDKGLPGFPVRFEVAQVTDAEHRRGSGDPGFRHVRGWHVEVAHTKPVEVRGDGKRATDRTDRAVEGQLSEPGRITREWAVIGGIDHRCRDRRVKAAALLRELGRSEVDRHPPAGEFEAAVVDRDLDPFARFLEGAVTQTDDVKPGQAIGDVGLHLDPDPIEAKHRSRQRPGQHSARILHDFVYRRVLAISKLMYELGTREPPMMYGHTHGLEADGGTRSWLAYDPALPGSASRDDRPSTPGQWAAPHLRPRPGGARGGRQPPVARAGQPDW